MKKDLEQLAATILRSMLLRDDGTLQMPTVRKSHKRRLHKTIKLSDLEKYLEDQIMLADKLLGRNTEDDPISIRAYRRCLQDIQEKFIK